MNKDKGGIGTREGVHTFAKDAGRSCDYCRSSRRILSQVGLSNSKLESWTDILQWSTITSMYRVFLGAPSKADIFNDTKSYKWHTISSSDSYSKSTPSRLGVEGTQSFIFPLATLEAASHRISLIYKNIIFDDASEMEGPSEERPDEEEPTRDGPGMVMLEYKVNDCL